MIATGLNGYINAQGYPKIGMLSVVIGAVVNIILDPIFIFLFDMGVAGAALATVISQAFSAAWVLAFLFGKTVIIPLQDYMQLNSSARINTPGVPTGNWVWRFRKKDITNQLKDLIKKI
jgi:Na+-driven multidrug efflux pump